MKVSVIVPIHNTGKFLSRCIESILNQTHKDLELILVNDDSTDDSQQICELYKNSDERVVLKNVTVHSAGGARNEGLSCATGDLIAFVDSDDWVEPEFLKVMHDSIIENNVDCAMCATSFHCPDGSIHESAQEIDKYFASRIVKANKMRDGVCVPFNQTDWYNCSCVWDKVYRKEMWSKIRFDEKLVCAEDRLVIFELFNDEVKTAVVLKNLYHYYTNIGISNRNKTNTHIYDYIAGYKMLDIAKNRKYELLPVYESITLHALGLARYDAFHSNKREFFDIAADFKEIYPCVKLKIKESYWKQLRRGARMLYYMPLILYYFLHLHR